jgi:hypothetical protein
MSNVFKKLIILFILIFATFITEAFSFQIADNEEISITITDSYVSHYIWRGQDLFGDNDAAHQPSIDIVFPKFFKAAELSFNIWGSFPLNRGHEDAEELDYTVAFSGNLLDEVFNVSTGYTYYDYPNTNNTSEVQEPWIVITLNKIPAIDISATIFAGYDFQAASGGPDEGWYYSWGFDTELVLPKLPFFQEGQTLAIGIVNWGNDGVADLKPSSLYATEVLFSTSYDFKDFIITPSFHYSINHEEQINSDDDEIWGGIEISYAF